MYLLWMNPILVWALQAINLESEHGNFSSINYSFSATWKNFTPAQHVVFVSKSSLWHVSCQMLNKCYLLTVVLCGSSIFASMFVYIYDSIRAEFTARFDNTRQHVAVDGGRLNFYFYICILYCVPNSISCLEFCITVHPFMFCRRLRNSK